MTLVDFQRMEKEIARQDYLVRLFVDDKK